MTLFVQISVTEINRKSTNIEHLENAQKANEKYDKNASYMYKLNSVNIKEIVSFLHSIKSSLHT